MKKENQSLEQLILLKEDLLKKINKIQETCEGSDNEENSKKILNLNNEKLKLTSQENKLKKDLHTIQIKLDSLNKKIDDLSSDGLNKILDAIDNQRFYFFKNKPKVILDIKTGAIITNLDYIDNKTYYIEYSENKNIKKTMDNLELEGYTKWNFLDKEYLVELIENEDFYLHKYFESGHWVCEDDYSIRGITISNTYSAYKYPVHMIACSYELASEDYEINIEDDNKVYTKEEKLKMSLNLFIKNDLEPIFEDDEITNLYKGMYIEKPILVEKLNEIEKQIDELKTEVVLSSTFDYNTILLNYDIKSIDNSIIKYYKAIQSWIDDLFTKLQHFEDAKWDTIREFNICGLELSKRYEENPNLDQKENLLLKNRQAFLRKNLDIGMNNVKNKLLLVKNQADNLESRIEDINDSENSIELLADLEEEKRASFNFIAENTANIIKNTLLKVEHFETNKDFIKNIINLETKWRENYKVFKTKDKDELKFLSEEDGIEEAIYMSWFEDWKNKRYILEESFTKLIEYSIKTSKIIALDTLNILEKYSKNIDDFYKNERKNIYQKYAFVTGGDIQEKLEVESELYKKTSKFQSDLQNIIFKLDNVEDRIFLLKWSNSIIDLQVDEVLYFVRDKELNKISETILNQFADLKRNNIENYISDAKLYSEEKANREKQFNSLMYKMRKELMA